MLSAVVVAVIGVPGELKCSPAGSRRSDGRRQRSDGLRLRNPPATAGGSDLGLHLGETRFACFRVRMASSDDDSILIWALSHILRCELQILRSL
jgi:hypothetical protein